MSEIDDVLSGSGSEIDSLLGTEKKKSSTARRVFGDTGISIAKGIVGVPEAAVGLADIVTGGRAGKVAEDLGVRFKDTQKALDELYSPEQQEVKRRLNETQGFFPTISEALQNPSSIYHAAVESAPSIFAGGALGRAARLAAPGMGGITAGAIGEGAISAGSTAEQVRQQTPDGLLKPDQAAIAAASGAATALLTRIGGTLAQRLGIADVDTLVASGAGAAAQTNKGAVRRVVEGMFAEGVFEELPQSAQEQIAQNVALDRPWDEGVQEAAAMGMLAGGLIGGGTAAVFRPEAAAPTLTDTGTGTGTGTPGDTVSEPPSGSQRPDPTVATPGSHPEVTAASGPISAAARMAIDTGASAVEQVRAKSAEAEQYQQDAAKGQFGPDEEARALSAIERQRDQDVRAMREFGPRDVAPPKSDAGPAEVESRLRTAAAAEEEAAQPREARFPFKTEKVAQGRAALLTKEQGVEHQVIPHPTLAGRFAVVPKEASDARTVEDPVAADAPTTAAEAAPAAPTVDTAAHEAASSPTNDRPEPTQAQALAGNYKMGHPKLAGMRTSIETPAGGVREDKRNTPPKWRRVMKGAHYGKFTGIKGADGDDLDLILKEGTPEDYDGPVYVVDQVKKGGSFDEHKVVAGPATKEEADALYHAQYDKGWTGRGAITEMSMDEFKAWSADPANTTKALAYEAPAAKEEAASPADVPRVDLARLDRISEIADRANAEAGAELRNATMHMRGGRWDKARAALEKASQALYNQHPDLSDALDSVIDDAWGKATAAAAPSSSDQQAEGSKASATAAASPETGAKAKSTATAPEHAGNEGKPLDRETVYEPSAPAENAVRVEPVEEGVVPLTMTAEQFGEVIDEWADLMRDPDEKVITANRPGAQEYISVEEASARIESWKNHAAAQSETHSAVNGRRTILSLFDLTGTWARPWYEAGYNVHLFDIQSDEEYGDVMKFGAEFFNENFNFEDVHGILVAVPCTDFAVSGARHFAKKDADGRTEASKELVFQALRTVEFFRPKFWVLENPVGRIETLTGLPKARMTFDPNHFGHPYTKKTVLWGKFNAEMPLAPVAPTEGSKMHTRFGGRSQATKNARSETPEGFAYSFFMANNYADLSPEQRLVGDYPEAAGAVRSALQAGVPEERINELMEYTYGNYEYDEARKVLAREVKERARPKAVKAPAAPALEEAKPPKWWTDRTPAERLFALRAANVKGTAATPWNRISTEDQARLNDQWGPKAPAERPELRKDLERRKRVAEMTPEEKDRALLTDDLTGLGNGRRLAEYLEHFPVVVAFDADSLKWVNDNMGHGSGDLMLKAWGEAIRGATEHGYRKGGDEFFALAKDDAEAENVISKVREHLAAAEIVAVTPSGQVSLTGIGVSHGSGTDLEAADAALNANKRERELAGQRAGRGEEPPGVRRGTAEGQRDPSDTPADTRQDGEVNGDRPLERDQPGDVQAPGDLVAEPDAAAQAEPDAARDLERRPAEEDAGGGPGEFTLAAPDQLRDRPEPRGDAGGGKPAPGRARGPRTGRPAAQVPLLDLASNFAITDELDFKGVGAKSKYRNNVAAIRLLKQLEAEGRSAATEEQSVLARYVGWGGIPQAFDPKNEKWATEHAELQEILTKDEFAAARRSTQDAHYTAQQVVQSMWGAVRRLGFTHGAVLEPSMGTGNFFGLMPRELARSRLTGVELDSITGRIAQKLYPNANVQVRGFNDVHIAPESFDLAIGNPPFGDQHVHDPQYAEVSKKFSIHNYFFAKSVESLRPGGILAMVVSNSLMDQQAQTARAWLAERARLLGAVRLPNRAFMANAGTEVTTDIVFLQKLERGEAGNAADWVSIGTVPDPDGGEAIPLNRYFIAHPEMLLGDMKRAGTMYGPGQPALIARADEDLGPALDRALAALPEGVYRAGMTVREAEAPANAELEIPPELRPYAHFVHGDRVFIKTHALNGVDAAAPIELEGRALERMKGMIEIRDAARALLRAEADEGTGDTQMNMLMGRLNKVYDAYVKANGFLNSDVNKRVFRDDADFSLLISLEKNFDKGVSPEIARKNGIPARKPTAEKADIFQKRVLFPTRAITTAGSAREAMLASLNERGFVDLGFMSRIYPKEPEAIVEELGELVYQDPDEKRWEPRDAYLSGNVKEKLAQARAAAAKDPQYERNVRALEEVQPKDIPAADIFVRIGSSWVAPEDYGRFAAEHFDGTLTGTFIPAVGRWMVQIRSENAALARNKWGTQRMSAGAIMEALMANHQVAVYDVVMQDGNEKRVVNPAETATAQGKADELAEAFQEWIWKDPERRVRLARVYNDRFNTNVDRVYDGSHLTFPGMTRTIELRPHQVNMVYRGLQSGVMLSDHVVGAGKTFGMAAIAIEGRRIGMHRKPMITVPNHLVEQWAKDIKRLYPAANVLAASRKDFAKNKRKALFAKIATGDWDAVVVAHKSFGFIPMPPDAERSILDEQMADLENAIRESRERTGKKDMSIKQLEKMRDRIKAKIEALADRKQDDVLNFAELGVDAVFVDEAHEFKNLFYSTTMQGVAGLGNPEGSIRAFDMFVKTRYVTQRNGGRGVYFATGTPVSNSIAETFHMQRYLQFNELKERGIHNFDAWASTFGQAVADWEMDAAGRYRQKTRFSKFANLGELRQLWRSVTDIVTRADLISDAEKQGKRFPLPKIRGGKPTNVVVERSPQQAAYIGIPEQKVDHEGKPVFDTETGQPVMTYPSGTIIDRLEHWKERVKENPREMPLVITGDARKAGLDFRLINEHAPDFPGSKVNEAARRIYSIWKANNHRKGTQLVFIDLSTPKAHKGRATEAAAAKVPTFFVRGNDGKLRHVAGVKTKLPAAPDMEFFSLKEGTSYRIYVTATGHTIGFGRTKQEAMDAAGAQIGRYGREALEEGARDNAIPPAEIDDYIARWEEEQAQKDDQGEDDQADGETEVSLDELLADQGGEFSVYDDLRKKLIDKGVPLNEIAFIHDYDSDIQKGRLFEAVNNGEIRVLFGSTMKMGAGMNVQRKLVASHQLDVPWKPSDIEQRDGRILRQGNEFYEQDPDGFEIEMLRYATKQTYDARMWEINERKAAAIEAFRNANGARELEDVSSESANAAEMKAGASGNPLILEEIQLRQELKKLETQRKSFERGKWDLQDMIRRVEARKGFPWDDLAHREAARKAVAPKPKDDALGLKVAGTVYKTKKDLPITTIAAEIIQAADKANQREVTVGEYRGFELEADMFKTGSKWNLTLRLLHAGKPIGATTFQSEDKWSAAGLLQRLDHIADGLDASVTHYRDAVAKAEKQAQDAAAEMTRPFAHQAQLDAVKERHRAVLAELRGGTKPAAARDLTQEAAQSRFDTAVGPSGLPSFWNDQVALARPRLAQTQPIEPGLRRMAFDILDTPAFRKAVSEFRAGGMAVGEAKVRAAARAKVGMVLLDLRGTQITALYNVEIEKSQRGRGHGQAAVGAMLESQDTPIRIIDIQEDAVAFWVKMGAEFPRSDDYMEAHLDRFQYATYRNTRARPEAPRQDVDQGAQGARAQAAGTGEEVQGQFPGSRRDSDDLDFTAAGRRASEQARATSSRAQVREWLAPAIDRAKVPVVVASTPGELRAMTGKPDLPADIEGIALGGRIYIVASAIRDPLHAELAFYHEAFHVGFRGAFGRDIEGYARALRGIAVVNGGVRGRADRWRARFGADALATLQQQYPDMTIEEAQSHVRMLAIEEALADMSGEQGANVRLKGLRAFIAAVQRFLRSVGLERLANWLESRTDAEALGMILSYRDRAVAAPASAVSPQQQPAFSRKGPLWYSELTRQVALVKMERAPAGQWKGFIKGLTAKGVKADEIEWSGVNEWLDTQTGPVTRDALVEFLISNGVRVEETMLGEHADEDMQDRERFIVELTAKGFEPQFNMDGELDGIQSTRRMGEYDAGSFFAVDDLLRAESGQSDEAGVVPIDVREMALDLSRISISPEYLNDEAGVTKYAQYTMPGGKNYRELLLTLPQREGPKVLYDGPDKDEAYRVLATAGKESYVESPLGQAITYRVIQERPDPKFRSTHFDTPNILAHVRFDERTDVEGRRVLFIEEIQSDWAQKGRREGFRAGEQKIEERNGVFFVVGDDGTVADDHEFTAAYNTRADAERAMARGVTQGVPKAPFIGKTEAWVGLTVKRMIRYAAEHGFDRVAFPTGEQSADRYDLSKQVDKVKVIWMPRSEAYEVTAYRGDRAVIQRGVADEDEMADLIGKDLAARAVNTIDSEAESLADRSATFTGLDLKVGGKGMVTFYDKIVPNVVNDVLKKLGGGRVGTVKISTPAETEESLGLIPGFIAEESKERFHKGGVLTQPGFDVTPAMRAITLEGMPVFMRAGVLQSGPMVEKIRKEASALWTSPRTFNPFHRTIGTQQHKASVDADFGRVFRLGQNYLQDVAALANEPADMAPTVLPMIRDLKDALAFAKGASKVDLAAVGRAIFDATLENKVLSTEDLRARGLNDRQIGQYREVRLAINRSLDQLVTSEAARLARREGIQRAIEAARNTPEHGPQIVVNALRAQARVYRAMGDEKSVKRLRAIALEVLEKAKKVRDLKARGYAPLQRFGQYTVYVTRQNGPETEQVYFGMYETKRAANLARVALEAEFPDATVTEGVLSQDAYRLFQGLSPDTLELFGDVSGIGQNELFQQYLRLAVNNRSALKRLIRRKGIEGYSEDVSRVLAQFLTSNARAASGNYHFGDMLDAVQAIPKEKGDVKDEAVRLMRYLQDPKEEAAQLRSLLFVQYLGGSIASALVNMTQPILMSFPFLAKWGARRAALELTGAGMIASGARRVNDAELEAALAKAEKDGVIAPQEIHQLQAEAIRGFGSNIYLRRGLALWGSFFSLAEQFNRRTTFIAAWRIAKADGVKDAFGFAEDAVKETQGIYNRGNRPNWARGAVGATLFTFKQFSIAYVEFLKRLPPKERALALAILVLAAGLQGLPFADDLDDIIDTIAQSLGYSWNTKQEKRAWLAETFGEEFANFVMFGASALPGVPLDIQGRLGLGNLLPGTALFKRSEPDKGRDLVEALGPAGGLAKSVAESLGRLQEGDVGGAVVKAMPVAIQNALKGVEMAQMGMYRDTRGRRVLDTDAYDAFIKSVGFQPQAVAVESRKIREATQNVRLTREVEADIADRWAQGVFERDPEKVQAAIARLRDWNEKNPHARIGIHPSQIHRRVREMGRTRAQRMTRAAPRELRPGIERDLR